MTMLLKVQKTTNRSNAAGEYLARLNETTKHQLGLGTYAVAVYEHPALADGRPPLLAVARVEVDNTVHGDVVQLDQTLRHALGIALGAEATSDLKVRLCPLKLTLAQRLLRASRSPLGTPTEMTRTVKCDVGDIESRICRLREEALELLGCKSGDRIIAQAAIPEGTGFRLKEKSVRVLAYTYECAEARKSMEGPSLSDRYPSMESVFGVTPDVPHLYVDLEVRQMLGGVPLYVPVLISRDVWHLFRKRFTEFGLVFFLSTLTITQFLPDDHSGLALLGAVLAGAGLSLGVVVTMIRADV